MIDMNQFWAVPGADEDENEGYETEVGPGVTPAEVAAWEAEHGVSLPEPFRSAFPIQDGEFLAIDGLILEPLARIGPVDDDLWPHTEITEDEAPDRALVFRCGGSDMGGAPIFNFNASGPRGMPSLWVDQHGEGAECLDASAPNFFEAMAASQPGWSRLRTAGRPPGRRRWR